MYGYKDINEQVSLLVGFGPDFKPIIQPFRLRWQGRDYRLSRVAHYYRYREGRQMIHVLSVTDGVNFFELKCESENLIWRLGRVGSGETS